MRNLLIALWLLAAPVALADVNNLRGKPLCFDPVSPYVAIVEIPGLPASTLTLLEASARKTISDTLTQRRLPLAANCLLEGGYNLFINLFTTEGQNQRVYVARLQVVDIHSKNYNSPVLHEVLLFGLTPTEQLGASVWVEGVSRLLANQLVEDWNKVNPR